MLDENLPNFYLKANVDGVKHHQAYYFSQRGSDPLPTYDLKHLDPAHSNSRNIYASALFDSHNPDVLFGEVLLKPGWTQPTLSQEEIRRNGGVAPPPQPILPTNFTIQLYSPDQQVEVTQKSSAWTGGTSYEFNMPQQSFRAPSGSDLDRSRHDPAADATIPKLVFSWKRDSRLSKDLTCFMTGKSTDSKTKKKKQKEPDIAIAMFSDLRDLTIVESNLHRVEMEDYKGLEVVLLLSAAVLRDVYFGDLKEAFHITDPGRKNSGGFLGKKSASPHMPNGAFAPPQSLATPPQSQGLARPMPSPSRNDQKRQGLPPLQTNGKSRVQQPLTNRPSHPQQPRPAPIPAPAVRPPPPADPRSQWEIEAETKRLRRIAEQEAEARRKQQAKVDKETEKLRRKYGVQGQVLPSQQQQQQQQMQRPQQPQQQQQKPMQRPMYPQQFPQQQRPPQQQQRPPQQQQPSRPYQSQPRPPRQNMSGALQPIPQGRIAQPAPQQPPSQSYFGGGGLLKPDLGQTLKSAKRSFLGLRSGSGQSAADGRLHKKTSSLF